jgi:hypothetical protein
VGITQQDCNVSTEHTDTGLDYVVPIQQHYGRHDDSHHPYKETVKYENKETNDFK